MQLVGFLLGFTLELFKNQIISRIEVYMFYYMINIYIFLFKQTKKILFMKIKILTLEEGREGEGISDLREIQANLLH